jgi:dTDP-4-amino-4,6-dideoxygalactose transaminase
MNHTAEARVSQTTQIASVAFVEDKLPNYARIQSYLDQSAEARHWANSGPLFQSLAARYAEFLNLPSTSQIFPCANAGLGLEAMARVWAAKEGRKLRWAQPSFSFKNLGRGYFADGPIVDCDRNGLLDLDRLAQLPADSYDGIIAVNPVGMASDFSAVIEFARSRGKPLLLDNASGLCSQVPDWPWQCFSLHHTKPFGMGEGGMALIPAECAAEFQRIIGYADTPEQADNWLNNAKLSDISCAFHLDRLDQLPQWLPASLEQKARIRSIAQEFDLMPIGQEPVGDDEMPVTSLAFRAPAVVQIENLARATTFRPGKYYVPIADTPVASDLFAHIVNIPAHPTMARLTDAQIREDISKILAG